jgi:hypothetical protein
MVWGTRSGDPGRSSSEPYVSINVSGVHEDMASFAQLVSFLPVGDFRGFNSLL